MLYYGSMTEKPFFIGEVGCASPDPITGITFENSGLKIPRVVILEPETPLCTYNNSNAEYQEKVEATGNSCIRADVYKDSQELNNLRLGFLAFEDVLNDPAYFSQKDLSQLVLTLKKIIGQSGLVLFTTSLFSDRHIDKYEKMSNLLQTSGFILLHDDLTNGNYIPSNTRDESQLGERLKLVLSALKKLDLVDEALIRGLTTHAKNPLDYWLVFQKRVL